MYAKT